MTGGDAPMLLDPAGDAPLPAGYTEVDSEVTFLRLATSGAPLLVRGEALCQWAERFFEVRELPFRFTLAPSRVLQERFPELEDAQARGLAQKLAAQGLYPQLDWPVARLLEGLFPQGRWREGPAWEHAAWWLRWLEEASLPPEHRPLLRARAGEWATEAEGLLTLCYQAWDREGARAALEDWLGLGPGAKRWEGAPRFPAELPPGLLRRLDEWARGAVHSDLDRAVALLGRRQMPEAGRRLVAEVVARYLEGHTFEATQERVRAVAPYLPPERQHALESLVPPSPPVPLDLTAPPEQALRWAAGEYMEYAAWAARAGGEGEAARHLEAARSFVAWLLRAYPRALVNLQLQRHLVFHRVRSLREHGDAVALLVVFDGLGWRDARRLERLLHERLLGWEVRPAEPLLAALPTVTEFAKPAILKGAPPRLALGGEVPLPDVGEVLPEGELPPQRLHQAQPGEVLVARINEPDRTYHERYSPATREEDVGGELQHLADKVARAAQQLPPDVPAVLVITSDHGRLLGAARRAHRPPAVAEAHGRAAWGDLREALRGESFRVAEEQGLVYLHAEAFGLPRDVAVPWDGQVFLAEGRRGGAEAFAHGGLFPEEAVVPWMVCQRGWAEPRLEARGRVEGVAGKEGVLHLEVRSQEDYPWTAEAVELTLGGAPWLELPLEWGLPALGRVAATPTIPRLPPPAQWRQVQGWLRGRVGVREFRVPLALEGEPQGVYRTTLDVAEFD